MLRILLIYQWYSLSDPATELACMEVARMEVA